MIQDRKILTFRSFDTGNKHTRVRLPTSGFVAARVSVDLESPSGWGSTISLKAGFGPGATPRAFATPKSLTSASPHAQITVDEMRGVSELVIENGGTPDSDGTYVRITVVLERDEAA